MMMHTLWPIAPDRTINVCEWHFHPRSWRDPASTPSDAIEFWDMTNRQDWHVCELSQAGIGSPRLRAGPVLEPRRSALRVRSVHRGVPRSRRLTPTKHGATGLVGLCSASCSWSRASGGVAVLRGGLKNGVFTTVARDAVADGFDGHLDLERRALGVVRRVDRRQRDQLLQHRRPGRRRRRADLAAVAVDRHGDARRGRRRRCGGRPTRVVERFDCRSSRSRGRRSAAPARGAARRASACWPTNGPCRAARAGRGPSRTASTSATRSAPSCCCRNRRRSAAGRPRRARRRARACRPA